MEGGFRILRLSSGKPKRKRKKIRIYSILPNLKLLNNNINLIKNENFEDLGFIFCYYCLAWGFLIFLYDCSGLGGQKWKRKGLESKKMQKVEKNQKSDIFVGAKLGKNAFLGGEGAKLG